MSPNGHVTSERLLPRAPFASQPGALDARRVVLRVVGLLAASVLVALGCVSLGAESIDWRELLQILAHGPAAAGETTAPAAVIIWHVRLPRIVLAMLVGGSLAGVGAALQALLRNPLADPYVLGVSSGAAVGGATALLLGLGATMLGALAVPLFAFLAAVLAIVLIYRIAIVQRYLSVHTMLLAGVILNAIFAALIMFLTSILEPNRTYGMLAWLMGTLIGPSWPTLLVLTAYMGVGGLLLLGQARALNLLALGEETARSLGVEVERTKRVLFFTTALLTGAAVSLSGLIGFVGMVVPHAVRLLGASDHRLLLPASVLVGAMFLAGADTLARTLLAPNEIPVGVVTALAGGPFFLYLLLVRRERGLT